MSTRGLCVFEHANELGNKHTHALFDRITLREKVDVPRSFADYDDRVDETRLPETVKLIRRVG